MTSQSISAHKRGFALIAILLIVATVSAIVFATSFSTVNEQRGLQLDQNAQQNQQEAEAKARGGIRGGTIVASGDKHFPTSSQDAITTQELTISSISAGDAYTIYTVPFEKVLEYGAGTTQYITINTHGVCSLVLVTKGNQTTAYRTSDDAACSDAVKDALAYSENLSVGAQYITVVALPDKPITTLTVGPGLPEQNIIAQGDASTTSGTQKTIELKKGSPTIPNIFTVTTL